MEKPSLGNTFSADIDYTTPFGNGIIERKDDEFFVGPAVDKSEGKTVEVTRIHKSLLYCHNKQVRREPYLSEYANSLTKENERLYPGLKTVVKTRESGGSASPHPTANIRGEKVIVRDAEPNQKVEIEIAGVGEQYAIADMVSAGPSHKSLKSEHESSKRFLGEIGFVRVFHEFGRTFSGEVVEIDSSGIGYIEPLPSTKLSIGPVICQVGEDVEVEYVGGEYAKCLTDAVRAENYTQRFHILSEQYDNLQISIGSECQAKIKQVFSDASLAVFDGIHINLDTTEFNEGELLNVRIQGFSEQSAHGEVINNETPALERDSETGKHNEKLSVTGFVQSEFEVVESDSITLGLNSVGEEKQNTSLEELKKKAISQSVEELKPEDRTVTNTEQYARSTAVKKYVKARAAGICEGCAEPAPFRSKTGEPYLHAHHIHELSDGGSDTPDTVIALCPNCHYRVHHGEDGEEYNQELLEKIQEIERGE